MKIVQSILCIISVIAIVFLIDLFCIGDTGKPVICFEEKISDNHIFYKGLAYNVYDCNSRNVDRELDLLRAFAKELGTKLLYFVPRDNIVQHAEINKKTVIEYRPESNQAQEYRNLAQAVIENKDFVIPTPMTQERLEEILMEYGMMELADDYKI